MAVELPVGVGVPPLGVGLDDPPLGVGLDEDVGELVVALGVGLDVACGWTNIVTW